MAKSEIVALSTQSVDVEYDEKTDVLYISFSPDSRADDSELTENDVLIRYKNGKIIGLTILHFSQRHKQKQDKYSSKPAH